MTCKIMEREENEKEQRKTAHAGRGQQPIWEMSDYVLFGAWIFVRSKWGKVLSLLAVSLFIGPKILLLLPAWAAGAMAFHASKVWQFSYRSSFLLFVATGFGVVAALIFQGQLGLNNGKVGMPPLYYSSDFIGDNIFAVVVAAHFFCCALFSRHLAKNLEPYRVVKSVRWLAGHTFSLYLYHLPILLFIRAIVRYNPHNLFAVIAAMSGTLLIIAGLSKVTEERYPALRTLLRRRMETLLQSIATKWKLHQPPQKI